MGSPAISNRLHFRADRIANFTESVIREMTRLALEHRAVNLAQGFPDFSAPEDLKEAARAGHFRRHQSIRHHLGREAVSRRHRREISRALMAWNSIRSAKSRSAAALPKA